jgi:hypothetical protein
MGGKGGAGGVDGHEDDIGHEAGGRSRGAPNKIRHHLPNNWASAV